MFSCCCVNKKALKKEQQLKDEEKEKRLIEDKDKANGKSDEENYNNNLTKSSQKIFKTSVATDVSQPISPLSEQRNDKSNSSEEGNLSGLIMSDGLVGETAKRI